jgi:hypothetical protein
MMRFSFSTVAGILPALLVLCSLAAAGTTELPIKVGDTEMEIGDRLRIRSKVMGVDPVKQTMKVAEKEVRLLDTTLGGQTLKTRLLDVEGKPADFATFKNGDVVLVLGYGGPDGHVYAMKIQRLDPAALASEPVSRHKSQFKRQKSQKSSQLQQSR